jgi:hypothetical protein
MLVVAVCLAAAVAQASSSNYGSNTSLFNPWSPSGLALEKAVERTLDSSGQMSHAGALDGFSSWSAYADYNTGKNEDRRQGGFDNYFNTYTVGADAMYNDTTLWGFMGIVDDEQGHSGTGGRDRIDSDTYSLYMSRPISEWMSWGTSFSYGSAETKIRGSQGYTDTETYVVAPYLTMMTQLDKLGLSLSPSYVLGYQDVDYPQGSDDDKSLMGKMVLMGRASYALTDKLSIAANLNFNQVLHNHALDNEYDTDQNWFTTGAKLNYNFTENLSGSFGYSTNLDSSNFDSKIWTFGLCYGF